MYGPKWPFLLMYGSHDMRHTGIQPVDGLSTDLREMGRRINNFTKEFIVWTTLRFICHALTPTILGCPSAYEMHFCHFHITHVSI